MARPGPATQAKRKRELAKLAKRKAKEERRALRKEQKALKSTPASGPGEDADIDKTAESPQDRLVD